MGEVSVPIERPETPVPEQEYRQIGVRLWGEGAYERELLDGGMTKYKTLNRVEAGDIIVNKIWARNGSVAVVSDDLAGCYCSSEFPTFSPNPDRLAPTWFHWVTKTRWFWERCDEKSRGTSGKNRIRPERFLEVTIPLPPLPEQRCIVARIEELAGRLTHVHILREKARGEATALVAARSASLFTPRVGWQTKRVGDFCDQPQYGYTESASSEAVGPHLLRITDIQDGQVNWPLVPYCRCPSKASYLLREGDLLFARTGATTGKSFVIRDCPEAVFASYLIRLRVRDSVSVDYLYHYFQSPGYWSQIADEKKGTGQPNLNGSKLASLKVPIPPTKDQEHIVAELDDLQFKVDELKRLQAEAQKELDALLPSILDRAFKGNL